MARAAAADLRFRILREGSQIGTHRVAFATAGAATTAVTEVDIAVRIAGITVFRLGHRFEEVWQNDRLQRVVSRMDRNGRVSAFVAMAAGASLRVEAPEGAQMLPGDAAPLTWWDARRVSRPLFANDTGRALKLAWTRADGPAGGMRLRCTGDEQGEGGYAADGTWTDWQTRGEDGSLVTYARA